jgi:hypothetical protein
VSSLNIPDFYTVDTAPRNFNNGVKSASITIDGYLLVYGFTVYNTKASAQFVNVFDASLLPADTAVPAFSFPINANTAVGFAFSPAGRTFTNGLVMCNSSTDATKTIGSADCFFDVQYDVVAVG